MTIRSTSRLDGYAFSITVRIAWLYVAVLFQVAEASGASLPVKNTCEKQYKELQTNPLYASTASKIKVFEADAFLCAGSGLYEVQLAQLYIEAGDLGKAKQILDEALKQNMPHRKELLFKETVVYGSRLDLKHAEEIDRLLIRDYPNSFEGYSGLGTVFLVQNRPKESIEQYEKANSLQQTVAAYRNLVIAYTKVGRYEDATSAFDKYYRADRTALGDRDVAMSVAVAYEKQGELEVADGALRALLKSKPGIKDDKEFVALFRKVNAELSQKH
jgi:tetratricopeptide (TPR) repeat protein